MQVVVEIPYVIIQAVYYTLIVYSMMNFQWTASKFFWFYFISFFSFLYFTYYGMMTVSISPNHQVAAIFAATFYSLFNLFSGFFIPKPVSFLPYNHNFHLEKTFQFPSNNMLTSIICLVMVWPAENSQMVDLVLLDLPGGMDGLRVNNDPIWRFGTRNPSSWSGKTIN